MAARYLKAWGWWLAGASTITLALWLATRHLYAGGAAGELDDQG